MSKYGSKELITFYKVFTIFILTVEYVLNCMRDILRMIL